MDPRLTLLIAGYSFGIILNVTLGFFVWIRARKNTLSTIFLFMNLSVALVEASILLVGASKTILWAEFAGFLNMANIAFVVLMAHWIFTIIGKQKNYKIPIAVIYISGILLFAYYLVDPQAFLQQPVPKLYLRHYFEPGPWYAIMRVYFAVITFYAVFELYKAYRGSVDKIVRNRIRYVFLCFFFGLVTGQMALFLVYDIPIDPVWSMFFPLGTIPLGYAIIRYELMEIQIVAKRALVYAVAVSIIAAILGLVGFGSDFIALRFPEAPRWLLPIIVSAIAAALGFPTWFRLREDETLKYEFITIMTHKFRTPLTEIKWLVEQLLSKTTDTELRHGLLNIARADQKLVELTNTLLHTSEAEKYAHPYVFRGIELPKIFQETRDRYMDQLAEKHIRVFLSLPEKFPMGRGDYAQISLVLQTIFENAVLYNRQGGAITVEFLQADDSVGISIKNEGVGLSREEMPKLFEKFYRTEGAKKTETEGMGIGLYIAKQIMDHHGGTIVADSEGIGKGAKFTLMLPKA